MIRLYITLIDNFHVIFFNISVCLFLLDFKKRKLLTVPRRYFFCGSFMFLFCLVFAVSVRVCLYVLCGHLLGKG